MMDGLHPSLLQAIERPTLGEDVGSVAISHMETLASYSWTNRSQPTIIVPGKWYNSVRRDGTKHTNRLSTDLVISYSAPLGSCRQRAVVC